MSCRLRSTVKFQVLLRSPVLPNLSIAYTLRVYPPASNQYNVLPVMVLNPLLLYEVPLISYRYPESPTPVPFVHMSVALSRSIFMLLYCMVSQERGEDNTT